MRSPENEAKFYKLANNKNQLKVQFTAANKKWFDVLRLNKIPNMSDYSNSQKLLLAQSKFVHSFVNKSLPSYKHIPVLL